MLMPQGRSARVAMLSFADIDNFGDVLFSYVVEKELSRRMENVTIDFFTPTDFSAHGRVYRSFSQHMPFSGYDALILAGGEVVHCYDERTWLPIYKKKNQLLSKNFYPSDIVWKLVEADCRFKAWLSVGVRPCGQMAEGLVCDVLNRLDYVSVRGALSKKILEGEYEQYDTRIKITPDLGWLFPGLVTDRVPLTVDSVGEPYVLFQAHGITVEDAASIAKQLVKFQEELGIRVFLIPIVKPWEDHESLALIRSASGGKLVVLSRDMDPLDIITLIKGAKAVLSGSLHCALTALAAGVPAGIINKWQGTKLQDIMGQQFRNEFLSPDYANVLSFLNKLIVEGDTASERLKLTALYMRSHVEAAFDDLCQKIQDECKRNACATNGVFR